MPPLPSRGEIWTTDLNPTRGHEQAGARPVLIVSTNLFNHGPADLVFVIPLTRTDRGIPFHIQVDPLKGVCAPAVIYSVTSCAQLPKNDLAHTHGEQLVHKQWLK